MGFCGDDSDAVAGYISSGKGNLLFLDPALGTAPRFLFSHFLQEVKATSAATKT